MIAENKTTLNPDNAYNILLTTTRKNINKRYIHALVIALAGVAIILIAIWNENSRALYMSFGGVFVAIAIAYAIYNFMCFVKAKNKVLDNNKAICENGITYNYKFKEQSIQILCFEGQKRAKLEYKYDSVKKVYESNDYYELRLKGYEILYVFKSGFNSPKDEEFFRINLNKNKKKIISKLSK